MYARACDDRPIGREYRRYFRNRTIDQNGRATRRRLINGHTVSGPFPSQFVSNTSARQKFRDCYEQRTTLSLLVGEKNPRTKPNGTRSRRPDNCLDVSTMPFITRDLCARVRRINLRRVIFTFNREKSVHAGR